MATSPRKTFPIITSAWLVSRSLFRYPPYHKTFVIALRDTHRCTPNTASMQSALPSPHPGFGQPGQHAHSSGMETSSLPSTSQSRGIAGRIHSKLYRVSKHRGTSRLGHCQRKASHTLTGTGPSSLIPPPASSLKGLVRQNSWFSALQPKSLPEFARHFVGARATGQASTDGDSSSSPSVIRSSPNDTQVSTRQTSIGSSLRRTSQFDRTGQRAQFVMDVIR